MLFGKFRALSVVRAMVVAALAVTFGLAGCQTGVDSVVPAADGAGGGKAGGQTAGVAKTVAPAAPDHAKVGNGVSMRWLVSKEGAAWRTAFNRAQAEVVTEYLKNSNKKSLDKESLGAFNDYFLQQLQSRGFVVKNDKGATISVKASLAESSKSGDRGMKAMLPSESAPSDNPRDKFHLFITNYGGHPLHGPTQLTWVPNTNKTQYVFWEFRALQYYFMQLLITKYSAQTQQMGTYVHTPRYNHDFSQDQYHEGVAFTNLFLEVGDIHTAVAYGSYLFNDVNFYHELPVEVDELERPR
jgi:hypothetical protein